MMHGTKLAQAREALGRQEPPHTEPYARWCKRMARVTLPPALCLEIQGLIEPENPHGWKRREKNSTYSWVLSMCDCED